MHLHVRHLFRILHDQKDEQAIVKGVDNSYCTGSGDHHDCYPGVPTLHWSGPLKPKLSEVLLTVFMLLLFGVIVWTAIQVLGEL